MRKQGRSYWSVQNVQESGKAKMSHPQLWTPELLMNKARMEAYPAEMVRPNEATEDDALYVAYDDYKALLDLVTDLRKTLRSTLEWIPANVPKLAENRMLALAYPPQTNPQGKL